MKKKTVCLLFVLLLGFSFFACCLTSCVSTQVEPSVFESETGVAMVVPMRVFTWVKADGAKTFMNDYSSGKVTFDYSIDNDFIVKAETVDGIIKTTWGKQFTDINQDIRNLVISAFISASYSITENKDGIETAFDVLNQIFSEATYTPRKSLLPPSLKNGLDAYQTKTDWETYKNEYFSIENGIFTIIK